MTKSNRTLLRGPRPGEKASPIQAWMADHPAAVKFVDDWLAARADGDTKWGAKAAVHHLREKHGFPFSATSGFVKWVKSVE